MSLSSDVFAEIQSTWSSRKPTPSGKKGPLMRVSVKGDTLTVCNVAPDWRTLMA